MTTFKKNQTFYDLKYLKAEDLAPKALPVKIPQVDSNHSKFAEAFSQMTDIHVVHETNAKLEKENKIIINQNI
jgi:hypothetical protein